MRGNRFLNAPAMGSLMVTLTPTSAIPLIRKKPVVEIADTEPFDPPPPKSRRR